MQRIIGIIANKEIERNYNIVKDIEKFFEKYGISIIIADSTQDTFGNYIYSFEGHYNLELLISLGGDGTVLQAAKNAIKYDVPILGFNTGTLGFLAENNIEHLELILEKFINKEYSIEERNMLEVHKDGILLDIGLNDIVISREGFSRIVSLEAILNGKTLLNKYRGDGIIVSTATGSTGYNLSVNGPILSPNCENFIVTPIACHTLISRSIVLTKNDEIAIKISHSRKTQEKEAILTCDGRKNIDLNSGDLLKIRVSQNKTKFIKINDKDYFDICREKLNQNVF